MIKTLFPVNVLIKDYELSNEVIDELASAVQAIFHSLMTERILTRDQVTNNEFPVFTEANCEAFPALKQLQQMFADCFYELASSYDENMLTREMIDNMVSTNVGRLPLMKHGEYKRMHGHTNASAFAIFYLTDVDNEKHGGKLILRDPSFHLNFGFHPPEDFTIATKKNRLVVVPGYIWHEVTPYTGTDDRLAIVVNLDNYIANVSKYN
jgi:hypothetical protein